MQKLERQFAEVRASNDDRKVKFIFSTDAKDRHGTRINPRGWRLDNFNKNGVASYQHRAYGDPDPDMIIGKANAWMTDNRLVGTIDFEPADVNPLADKLYKKVKNGTLNAVSVGFMEHSGHWGDEENEEEPETYYFDDVELAEISLVSVPSNPEALAVRSFEAVQDTEFIKAAHEIIQKRNLQTDLNEVTKSIKMEKDEKQDLTPETRKVEVEVKLDTSKFEQAVEKLVEAMPKPELPGAYGKEISDKEEKELRNFSIAKAIYKQAEAMQGRKPLDGIEKEMHEEACRRNAAVGITIEGLGIPSIVHSRALKATVDASGGYAVATDLPGFIDTLKNNLVTVQAGATVMSNLQGDISIPRAASNSTSYWVSEGGTVTESNPTFEAVTMSPNRLSSFSTFTRQLLKQSSIDIEAFVLQNLFYSVANALETATFTTDGTSQTPVGLASQSSINLANHGSNGTLMNWENIVGMESMVAVDNALAGRLAYITNASTAAALKITKKDTYQGGFIWENYAPIAPKGMINGYDAFITNVLSNAAVNKVFFGDWSQLMIGQWGDSLDLIVNPFSGDTTATIRVVLAGYYDIAVRHPQSFAYIKNLRI